MELFRLLGKIAIDNDDANKALKDTSKQASNTADDTKSASSAITESFKKIGKAVATFFAVDKIKDFGLSCIQAVADLNASSSQFTQVFGELESSAASSLSKIADDTGIVENRMKGSFTQIAAFAKTTGMETPDALALTERAMVAVADSAAFYDRSLEETTESLQSFLKGNFENDAALGLSCTETTRNAAANELYGKSFKNLSESQKQLTLLQMVEDANKLSGAVGQASRESDTWTNQTGNLKQAWEDFKAVVGQNFLDPAIKAVKKLVDGVQTMSDKWKDAKQWVEDNETAIGLFAIGVGTLTTAIGLYSAAEAIKNIAVKAGAAAEGEATVAMGLHTVATNIATTATTAFGAVLSFITSPITLVVAAIGALIAIGVLLYKNWDTISVKCKQLWTNVKEWFSKLKDSISEKVEEIKDKISDWASNMATQAKEVGKNFIDKIVTFFKELPGKVWTWLTDTVNKITSWGADMVSKGKEAAVKLLNAVVTKVKEIPGKIANVGSDLAKGIWSGISNSLSWIKGKIKGWVGNVTKFIKKLFGIKSPSTVMRDEVGRELARGVAVGIEENTDVATKAMKVLGEEVIEQAKANLKKEKRKTEELNAEIIAVAKDKLNDYKMYNDLTAKAEADFWNEIRAKFTEGTAERLEADKEYFEARNKIDEDLLAAAEKRLDEYRTYNDMTIAEEAGFWAELRQNYEKGTDARLQADKKYLEAKKEWNEGIVKAEEDLQKSLGEIYEKISDKTKSFLDSFNLFKVFENDDEFISGSGLFDALDSQIKTLEEYAHNMELLRMQIGDTALYETIKSMGLEASGAVKTMLQMIPYELRTYAAKFDERNRFASATASWLLSEETAASKAAALQAYDDAFFALGGQIQWNARAMNSPLLLDKPTIFGYNSMTGKLMGAGEAGQEVVSGTNTLMGMIQNAVAGQNSELVAILSKILSAILALDENMGGNLREAFDGIGFKFDKREVARMVKAVT